MLPVSRIALARSCSRAWRRCPPAADRSGGVDRREIDAPKAMSNRLAWVSKRRDAGWIVVHEHTSAPADFDGARLILQR